MFEVLRDIAITIACGAYVYTAVISMEALQNMQEIMKSAIGG